MAGTFPTSPEPARIRFGGSQPTIVSTAISGRRQTRQIAGHLWQLTCTWPPMKRDDFMPVFAFMQKQRGVYDSFTIVVPKVSARRATTTAGTPVASDGVGTITIGTSLYTENWGEDGVCMKAGDLFKLSSSDKVYMITEDATASSGAATLNFIPDLITLPSSGEALTVDAVPMTVSATNTLQEYNLGLADMVSFELDLVEVL